jgi:predicted ATPase/serine/threonine protein kinase/DNA-binding CsgD family transcriptional regulator
MVDRVGQQLGNYQLVSLLGQGGYAEVYLGQHVRFKQQAAIKVLHAHLRGQEIEHFQQEAETIATLAHPSIVRVFDFDVQDGIPFLVMDYAPNGSLRQRSPKGSLMPLPQIVSCVKQVAAALQYAHDQKFIHRDVKPENMLIGQHQEILLSDFGIATIAHSTSSLNVDAQGTSGTLAYMAPEQIEGHPRAASDQYALGIVVYEWLCGKPPFEGSMSEVMVQHLSMPPPPLRERVPTVSVEMEQVVLQALAKDPKLRFASVQDFALTLEEACSTEVSSGHTLLAHSSTSAAHDRHTSTHNLPAPLTPLLGREREVAAACTLLRRPEVRLVTLTGTGGVGKTRLATAVATELLADFPDGVFLVSLAPISDPALVIPTIAQALDVKESGVRPLLEILTADLRDKRLLLCLDNFEQLLEASPRLSDLLARCPYLTLLVTSRAVLHVQGEHEFPVPPLAVPDLTPLPSTASLPDYAAVALFLERAQAVQPTFQLTSANARPVAEICVRLDGLPLAIELAAARIKLLSPQALLARLSQRFAVLTSGARDAPGRQQTLHNTIEWSYQLLDTTEQRLLRRLSVFVGGCMLEGVEAVCAALDGEATGVVDGVSSLLDKSLLQRIEQERQASRLVMLETIREYGWEELAESGELEASRQAHAHYYLQLAEEAERELRGVQAAEALERLEREHDNLQAVMQWFLERGELGHNIELALRLGGALWRFWNVHGHWSEGRAFLERALADSKGVAVPVQVKALRAAAKLADNQGDTDRAEALYEERLALCRGLGDTGGMALSLRILGMIAYGKGSLEVAYAQAEEALALFREVGDKEGIAQSLAEIAHVLREQGEYARAIALHEEALALFREAENMVSTAKSHICVAEMLFFSQGDPARVRTLLEEGLVLSRELGYKANIAWSFALLGRLALSEGDAALARSLVEESLELYRELGDREGIGKSLFALGRVAESLGDYASAHAHCEESLAIGRVVGDNLGIASCLEELSSVVAAQGEPTWAAQLWGAAEAQRSSLGTPMPPVDRADYERSVAAARAHLGKKAFVVAWEEGRTMTAEQALAVQGRTLVPTTTAISPIAISAPAANSPITYPAGLTAREVEVLRLVALGLTNEQVVEQLDISPRTVKTHLTAIYGKIGVTSRRAATRYALEHEFV